MNEKCQTLKPLGRLCMTIGELPASYVESMSYYEQLLWLTKFLQEQVIPVVNHNSNIVNELQDYVEHYFDNLDVQEEINNKLDDMVESGDLQTLIFNYLNFAQNITFENVNEMMDSENITKKFLLNTLGYYNKGDLGACKYYVVDVEPENTYYLKLKNSLYAIPLNKNIEIEQLGAVKDETTLGDLYENLEIAQKYFPNATTLTDYVDYIALQTACNYFENIHLNTGKYYVNNTITLNHDETKIIGNGYVNTAIQYNLAPSVLTYIIDINSTTKNEFKDFTLMSIYTAPVDYEGTENYLVSGFKVQNTQYNHFDNVRGYKLYNTWYLNNTWCNTIERCKANKAYIGVKSEGSDNNNIVIRNSVFQHLSTGIYLTGGRSHLIDSCDIEDNGEAIYREGKGDIEITNCYFEDHLRFAYTNSIPIDNILITGCSFWIGTNYTRIPCIRYDGNDTTKMTIISCNFELSDNATTQSNPVIDSYNTGTTTDYVKPTIINCNVVSQGSATAPIINNSRFEGILINKNKLYNTGVDKQKYINIDNNATLTLSSTNGNYRLGGTSGRSSTFIIPELSNINLDCTEYNIYVAGNIANDNSTSFTLTGSANITIGGNATYTLGDLSGKLLKIKYLGQISSKAYWQTYVI